MRKFILILALMILTSFAFGQTPYTEGYCTKSATNGSCQMTASGSGSTALTINTAGDTIVVMMGSYQYWSSGMTYSMSSTGTGGFTCASLYGNASYGESVQVCWALATSSGSYSPTCSSAGGTFNVSCSVGIFAGSYIIDTTTTPYASGFSNSNVTSMTAGTTSTTTGTTDVVIGAFQTYGTNYACSAAGSYTAVENHCTVTGQLLEYLDASSSTTFQATGTLATAYKYAGYTVALMPQPATAVTPTLSPNGVALGFTSPATTVTITSTTSGATDIYTTDGSTPGTSSGCTPSGTGTALTQSGTTGVTVNLSTAVTLKAIACLSGDVNSSVASAVFTLFPDQPLVTAAESATELGTFYNPAFNIDTINGIPAQYRLDTWLTPETISSTNVSAYAAMGYGTGAAGAYVYSAIDYLTNSFGIRGGVNVFGEAVRTAETYPANQYASAYFHYDPSSVGHGIEVGTNGAAGSTLSGNKLSVSTAASNNVTLYINGSSNTTITLAPAEGDQYEMRQYGTICVPLKNGAQVTGLSTSYTCTPATGTPFVGAEGGNDTSAIITFTHQVTTNAVTISFGSNPFQAIGAQVTLNGLTTATWLNGQTLTISSTGDCAPYPPTSNYFCALYSHATYSITSDTGTAVLVGSFPGISNAVGYNISMGAIAATSPGVTPISWGGPSYSNYTIGTITSSTTVPYPTWMVDGLPGSNPPTAGTISQNVGNALGGQYAIGSGGSSGGDIQQVHHFAPFQNLYWFHHLVTVDATAWTNTNEFLKFASQPFNAPSAMPTSTTGSACYDATSGYIGTEPQMQGAVACGPSVEYCNTHKLHVTFSNNLTATIATATANLTGTSVTSVTFTTPITVSTPTATVYFWGGAGSGATATATMTAVSGGYQVSGVTVTAGGSYTTAPFVTIVPGSGSSQACNAIPNYEIRTAVGFETTVMHGDEVLGVWNESTSMLTVYVRGGSGIGGWTASTTVTPRVNSVTAGTTGTTIQAAGLYQVAISDLFQASFAYPLNAFIFDGSHWQKVTTAGTSGGSAPSSWNHSGGTTSSGTAIFTDEGTTPSSPRCTDPCTGATEPSVWGGTTSTCETTTTSGALTPDGTAIFQCAGEAATSATVFQPLGTVYVPGFGAGYQFPGIWANSNNPTYGNWPFQDYEDGSGNPCTNGKYTCASGVQRTFVNWWQ